MTIGFDRHANGIWAVAVDAVDDLLEFADVTSGAAREVGALSMAYFLCHAPMGCLIHPHRLTHPFQGVPGIYGVALFAFLLR